jgi:hypothetical protein
MCVVCVCLFLFGWLGGWVVDMGRGYQMYQHSQFHTELWCLHLNLENLISNKWCICLYIPSQGFHSCQLINYKTEYYIFLSMALLRRVRCFEIKSALSLSPSFLPCNKSPSPLTSPPPPFRKDVATLHQLDTRDQANYINALAVSFSSISDPARPTLDELFFPHG